MESWHYPGYIIQFVLTVSCPDLRKYEMRHGYEHAE